jgi:hypothetical protein
MFADPFDQFSYKAAFDDCRILGLQDAAAGYGGVAADPSSVARAYAEATYSRDASYREAAAQGCLDAFDEMPTD